MAIDRAWVEVDSRRLASNARALAAVVAPAELCVVVKADGYGHGALLAAEAAVAGGVARLATAHVAEAVALREAGISAGILVLSPVGPGDLDAAVRADLTLPVATMEEVVAFDAAASAAQTTVDVHLVIDTGMHRSGCDPSKAVEIAQAVETTPSLRLDGVWSHLACADDADIDVSLDQRNAFADCLDALADADIEVPVRHLVNSAGAIRLPEERYDLVRCGIAFYGIAPSADVALPPGIEPALQVKAEVSSVRRVAVGEGISYGHRYRPERAATIATLPLGYGDGIPRNLGIAGGEVLINGRRRRVAGAVTMDQLMVDCGDDVVSVGDEAVLIGQQGAERIEANEWADALDTIGYEIVTRLGHRLRRVHG